jgi:hypothetical protein
MECNCGKIRYYSRDDAKRAAKAMKGKGRYPGHPLRPYRCPGGFWHLTSNPTSTVTWYRERGMS